MRYRIVGGKATPTSCVAGGPDLAAEIAEILGVEVVAREPDIARPGCTYGIQDADLKYLNDGAKDCRAAVLLNVRPVNRRTRTQYLQIRRLRTVAARLG